jgi:hypothetical protein
VSDTPRSSRPRPAEKQFRGILALCQPRVPSRPGNIQVHKAEGAISFAILAEAVQVQQLAEVVRRYERA